MKHKFELIYFKSGEGTHHIDFEIFTIKPNQIYVLQPGQIHMINVNNRNAKS